MVHMMTYLGSHTLTSQSLTLYLFRGVANDLRPIVNLHVRQGVEVGDEVGVVGHSYVDGTEIAVPHTPP